MKITKKVSEQLKKVKVKTKILEEVGERIKGSKREFIKEKMLKFGQFNPKTTVKNQNKRPKWLKSYIIRIEKLKRMNNQLNASYLATCG